MDGTAIAAGARVDGAQGTTAGGIFLHTGWRSCGSWMWERLREHQSVEAFYEPLHEDLAHLRVRDIGLLRPDSWQSGHSRGAPYFTEYAPLLGRRGGVRNYATRFAFDNYFRPPAQDDAALEQYLRALIGHAAAHGRLPVLKFCRSLGRVPWLEARFPDIHHTVILRDPGAQWRSARRQMTQNGNRYFVVAPFVILARNAKNPLLMDAAERLGVKWPPGLGRNLTRDLGVTEAACWRHVSRLTWQDRFRGFLALWVASGLASVQGGATLIDADRLGDEPALRGAAEAALGRATGLAVDLMPDRALAGAAADDGSDMPDMAACLQAAREFLRTHGGEVARARMAVLADKLGPGEAVNGNSRGVGASYPGALAYADAAAYIAVMRASYPLRRAHFHARSWFAARN